MAMVLILNVLGGIQTFLHFHVKNTSIHGAHCTTRISKAVSKRKEKLRLPADTEEESYMAVSVCGGGVGYPAARPLRSIMAVSEAR